MTASTEKRLDDLEAEHTKIFNSLERIRKSLDTNIDSNNRLTAEFKAHIASEQGFEQTIRNIDNNVTVMKIDMAKTPMHLNKAIKEELDPVWHSIRKHDAECTKMQIDSKDNNKEIAQEVSTDIKKWIKTHLFLIWGSAVIIWGLAIKIHYLELENIKATAQMNKEDVSKNTRHINALHKHMQPDIKSNHYK